MLLINLFMLINFTIANNYLYNRSVKTTFTTCEQLGSYLESPCFFDTYLNKLITRNFPNMMNHIIYKSGRSFDFSNEEDKQQLYRKLILGDLLQDYYEKSKKRDLCQYGNLYNNIFNPILNSSNKSGFKDL